MSHTHLKSQILDAQGIQKTLLRIAHEILERQPAADNITVVGIRSRGEVLAKRLVQLIPQIRPVEVSFGALDITLYRDDLSRIAPNPVVHGTEIEFDVSDRIVVLVDDVLFTGRTIRAAMDALTDLGRPQAIQLAALVDRGHRELPIRADFVGKNIATKRDELVQVRLEETDDVDEVVIEEVVS